ncbi:hypothetical protein ACFFQW_25030 [Umezawaea endophytica]|uniref:Uncharacterized protein n=1 Tax=Umezawaea endophytica TaxID=1654476 RepID=A0A9X2VMY4_9PSEU|nr:hypothetical protein [Umezawaea endophytica]MCS7479389.1 hypothetical protein [Umezawaea endophytica]
MPERNPTAPPVPLPSEAVDVARAVVRQHFDSESEAFDDILLDYEADPDGTVRGVRLDAPVGIGIELAAITPYVLTAAGVVAGVVVEKAADSAVDSVQRWLKQAWARRRGGEDPVSAADPEGERVVTTITVNLVVLGADEQTARTVARHVVAELAEGGHREIGRPE